MLIGSSSSYGMGGIIGIAWSESEKVVYLKNLHNEANVFCVNANEIGGIAGKCMNTKVSNCSNSGTIRGSYAVGGITGKISDTTEVSKNYNIRNSIRMGKRNRI